MPDVKEKAKVYGSGSVYEYRGRWIVEFHRDGRRYRKSAPDERGAARLLRRMREAAPEDLAPRRSRATLADLSTLLADDYAMNQRATLARAKRGMKHATAFFGATCKASDITAVRLKSYVATRLEAEAKPATVLLELAALKRAFNLALGAGLVTTAPKFPTISVQNTRHGFFEDDDLHRVLSHLPEHLRPMVRFAAMTGWRRGEVVGLTWKQVDFEAGTVRLEPGSTKNREGRTFPFGAWPALKKLLREQRARTKAMQRERRAVIPHVFHKRGKPLSDFYTSWRDATAKAGVPGRLFHDLRRTAVRNLERAGVPRSWATKLTGHKTEAVYRRYAIVSEADLGQAVARLAAKECPRSAPEAVAGAKGGHEGLA